MEINNYSVYEFNFFGKIQKVICIDNHYYFIDMIEDFSYRIVKEVKYSLKYKLLRGFWTIQIDDKIYLFHDYSLAAEYLKTIDFKNEIEIVEEIKEILLKDYSFEELQKLKSLVISKNFNVSSNVKKIKENKEKRLKELKNNIELFIKDKNKEELLIKDLIAFLNISKPTFYNLQLDEYLKEILEKNKNIFSCSKYCKY